MTSDLVNRLDEPQANDGVSSVKNEASFLPPLASSMGKNEEEKEGGEKEDPNNTVTPLAQGGIIEETPVKAKTPDKKDP